MLSMSSRLTQGNKDHKQTQMPRTNVEKDKTSVIMYRHLEN